MRNVKLTDTAKDDLKQIWNYVAEHNTESANKLIKEITSKFALLRDYPHIGRSQDKLLINLRSFVVKDYIIFYQPFDDEIHIFHILHSSQDIVGIFQRFLDSL